MQGNIQEKLAAYRKQVPQDSDEIFVARSFCDCICNLGDCCCETDRDFADRLNPDAPFLCHILVGARDCIYGCFCRN